MIPILKIEQLIGFSKSEFRLKIAISIHSKDCEFLKFESLSVLSIKDCEIFQTNRIRNLSWKNDLFFEFERFGNLSWRKNVEFFLWKIAYSNYERLQVLLFWKIAYSFRMKESAIFQNKRILQSFINTIRNLLLK